MTNYPRAYSRRSPKEQIEDTESERDFASKFEQLLTLKNIAYYHTYDSRRSNPGFPDYVCVIPGPNPGQARLIFVELKRESGKLSPSQTAWKAVLEEAKQDYYCWKPSQWDEITEVIG